MPRDCGGCTGYLVRGQVECKDRDVCDHSCVNQDASELQYDLEISLTIILTVMNFHIRISNSRISTQT